MKRTDWTAALILVALLLAGCACTGCSRFKTPAAIPSNQMTPVVWNEDTRDTLMNATDKDSQVFASALEQNAEAGSVFYIDHYGWVYNPDGTVFLDKQGRPLRTRTKVIAKLNSAKLLANMEGVTEIEYDVAGFEYVDKLPEALKGKDLCPAGLRFRAKGIGKVAAIDPTAANREAAGRERSAIFTGMSALATAKGAAFAVRVEAIASGVKAVTAAGAEIIGQVIKTTVLPVPADLLAAGVKRAVSAVLRTPDNALVDVVADGDNAAALEAASK